MTTRTPDQWLAVVNQMVNQLEGSPTRAQIEVIVKTPLFGLLPEMRRVAPQQAAAVDELIATLSRRAPAPPRKRVA